MRFIMEQTLHDVGACDHNLMGIVWLWEIEENLEHCWHTSSHRMVCVIDQLKRLEEHLVKQHWHLFPHDRNPPLQHEHVST